MIIIIERNKKIQSLQIIDKIYIYIYICMMQETQEDYYLVLFMFTSQLYFYVLSLLVYWAISILIWKQGYFCNKVIRVS